MHAQGLYSSQTSFQQRILKYGHNQIMIVEYDT